MSYKVFLFRHVETMDNRRHIFSGHRDVSITKRGAEQAQELTKRLMKEDIAFAFASPLRRTLQTMEIVLKPHQHVSTCIDPRIIERSYGWLEGQSKDRWARLAYPLFKMWHRSYSIAPPGGESLRHVRGRVLPFVKELVSVLQEHQQNAVICAHGNSLRGIREYFEGLPERQFAQMETRVGELFEYEL